MRDTISINKSIIPYTFNILLGGEVFAVTINYNNTGEFFTATLSKDGEVVCAGEKLVYGVPLFKDIYRSGVFPSVDIIPYDESGENKTITFDNLSSVVILTIDNGGDDDE